MATIITTETRKIKKIISKEITKYKVNVPSPSASSEVSFIYMQASENPSTKSTWTVAVVELGDFPLSLIRITIFCLKLSHSLTGLVALTSPFWSTTVKRPESVAFSSW